MFCSACGNKLDVGAKFCTKCGAKNDAPAVNPVEQNAPVTTSGEKAKIFFKFVPRDVLIDEKNSHSVATYIRALAGTKQTDTTAYEVLITKDRMYLHPVGKLDPQGLVKPNVDLSRGASPKIMMGDEVDVERLSKYPSFLMSSLKFVTVETKGKSSLTFVFAGDILFNKEKSTAESFIILDTYTSENYSLGRQLFEHFKVKESQLKIFK
jgi:hypothetical protein